jgi:hypothetical protein
MFLRFINIFKNDPLNNILNCLIIEQSKFHSNVRCHEFFKCHSNDRHGTFEAIQRTFDSIQTTFFFKGGFIFLTLSA